MPCTWLVMLAVAPLPSAIKATTAPTPMIIPSMVSPDRSLFASKARKARRMFSLKFIAVLDLIPATSVLQSAGLVRHRRRHDRVLRVVYRLVAHHQSVGDAHDAVGVARDDRVVGHVDHGLAQVAVQPLKQRDDLGAGLA